MEVVMFLKDYGGTGSKVLSASPVLICRTCLPRLYPWKLKSRPPPSSELVTFFFNVVLFDVHTVFKSVILVYNIKLKNCNSLDNVVVIANPALPIT